MDENGSFPTSENPRTDFELIGDIGKPEVLARGSGIRELTRLPKIHDLGNWRERKRRGYGELS